MPPQTEGKELTKEEKQRLRKEKKQQKKNKEKNDEKTSHEGEKKKNKKKKEEQPAGSASQPPAQPSPKGAYCSLGRRWLLWLHAWKRVTLVLCVSFGPWTPDLTPL